MSPRNQIKTKVIFLFIAMFFLGCIKSNNNDDPTPVANKPPAYLTSAETNADFKEKYGDQLSEDKVNKIIIDTQILATKYSMPEQDWQILLERKFTIASEIAMNKRAATSQAEIDSLSAAETTMQRAEDSTVLVEEPNGKVSLQSKLDQYKNEFMVCIKSAGDDRKAQMRCQITYNGEVIQAQEESL